MPKHDHLKVNVQLPPLYPKQKAAIFCKERYAIIEASTKSGKTAGCMAWLLGEAIRKGAANRHFWWVAPVYPQGDIAFRRTAKMLRDADPEGDFWEANQSKMAITLGNGAMLWYKSGDKPDTLYGEDVYACVIDEATRVKEDSWHAVRSTLTATKGRCRIIGNVKGRRNWVWPLARKAEAGEPGWHYARLTAFDAVEGGIFDIDEIDDARATLPEHVFRELYMAEAARDEGNPFGIAAIQANITPELAPGPVSHWGVDLAKYVDHTVALGLNHTGQVCAFQRWQSDWKNTLARLKAMLSSTPALIDATGVGDVVFEDLCYVCPGAEGFKFSASSKQELMQTLASAIHQGQVGYPPNSPACPLVGELEAFEYIVNVTGDGHIRGVRYGAPPGMHDDCVDALALAVRCANTMHPLTLSNVYDTAGHKSDDPRYTMVMDDDVWTEH